MTRLQEILLVAADVAEEGNGPNLAPLLRAMAKNMGAMLDRTIAEPEEFYKVLTPKKNFLGGTPNAPRVQFSGGKVWACFEDALRFVTHCKRDKDGLYKRLYTVGYLGIPIAKSDRVGTDWIGAPAVHLNRWQWRK